MLKGIFKGRNYISSAYGSRVLNGVKDTHAGLDIVGRDDTTVYAPCGGVIGASTIVTNKNDLTWQWGNYVRLDVDDTYSIYMCHMAERKVKVGQRVKAGDILGVMGNTGYSFGAHTHFEVRKKGTRTVVDPAVWLGIPNQSGYEYVHSFERTAQDYVDVLAEAGIISKPEYWKNRLVYDDEDGCLYWLFRKFVEYIGR